jgi:N-methylhydantoinase A
MQSNGGLCEAETGGRYPVRLIESGPAAGALAAAHYGALLGHKDLLSFDMGGTTAKACVIADGEPLVSPEFEVDRRYHFKKGSGLPIKVPVIEMIEIGTGGGSIARVDALRRLLVGPESAGARPGPVAYGLGGTEPTVTDADLVLGYLDPGFFLGGHMRLDREAARRAIAERVGQPLGLDPVDAAWGVHQLANESMASAARIHAIERGKDVERFPIFAFGGAGPVHAFGVARILRSPSVIYPLGAGVMSAVGFLVAPLSFDFVRTLPGTLDGLDWDGVARLVADMEAEGRAVLGGTIPADRIRFRRFADMRYRKQGYEIRVPIPDGPLGPSRRDEIRGSFEATYRAIYGHTVRDAPVEVVSWRVVAQGPRPTLRLPTSPGSGGDPRAAQKGTRPVYLPDARGYADVLVYDRYALGAGIELKGPAVIEERESTVVVNAAARIRVDDASNVIVEVPPVG